MNKKGSYIMEAAVVLPIIILTTITSILIIMFFFSQMTERCRLHMALREEAGIMSGQTVYRYDSDEAAETDAEVYSTNGILNKTVYGKKYLIMEHKGLLEKKGTFALEGSCYSIDSTDYVRYSRFVKGITDDQEKDRE